MSTKKKNGLSFPNIPKGTDYEDYVASLLASGYFLERGIHCWIDSEELLELDIIATRFEKQSKEQVLLEIKSGDWGYSDILKVYGWMNFLKISKSAFVVQDDHNGDRIDITKEHCKDFFNIDVILNKEDFGNQKLDNNEILTKFNITDESAKYYFIYRIAFGLEAEMLIYLHGLVKEINKQNGKNQHDGHPELIIDNGYKKVEDYYRKINSSSFFCESDISRINTLYNAFKENANISGKLSNYLVSKVYDESVSQIDKSIFEKIFYEANEISPMYVALYTEYIGKLELLKTCVSDIITSNKKNWVDCFFHSTIPENITNALSYLEANEYFHLYPLFWQIFTYLFGGFILGVKKSEEYELLSKLSGIPINEIDNAFGVFDVLFPMHSGKKWLEKCPNTDLIQMKFFPIPLHGNGVFFRAINYKKETGNSELDYLEDLKKNYSIYDHTIDNMRTWVLLEGKFLELGKRFKDS